MSQKYYPNYAQPGSSLGMDFILVISAADKQKKSPHRHEEHFNTASPSGVELPFMGKALT